MGGLTVDGTFGRKDRRIVTCCTVGQLEKLRTTTGFLLETTKDRHFRSSGTVLYSAGNERIVSGQQ